MGRYSNLRRIASLDPASDYDEIFRLTTRYEFPWDYQQGTSFAFLRDYGIPSISRLLDDTGQFENHGQKRYDDTILIGAEATEEGLDSARGRRAMRHLNRIHGSYDIPNDEFVYVLATTVVGPKRWIDRYGWRPLHPHEIQSMAIVTTRFGELMGLTGLPHTYRGFERYLDEYEAERFEFDPANRRVTDATLRIFAGWFPAPLRPAVTRAAIALMDDPLREALGQPRQPARLTSELDRLLRLRATALRLAPPRPASAPYRHNARSYPTGYSLADLGPAPG